MPGAPDLPVYLRRDGAVPDPVLEEARRAPGLQPTVDPFGRPAWLVSRYDDARAVLGDAELFTSGNSVPAPLATASAEGDEPVPALIMMDAPDHTRLRRMLTGEFTAARVRRLEPWISRVVDEHLDAVAAAGPPTDLVPGFALGVPSQVICELLGVPAEDRGSFSADVRTKFDYGRGQDERVAATARLTERCAALADRARADPGDDLLGRLVTQHGDELSRAELTMIAGILVDAGFETTASTISLSVLVLLAHPDARDAVRDDPSAVPGAVEELLRYLSVVQIQPPRRAARDTVVAGQAVAAGDLCVVSLPSADHDRALVPDPEVLDVTREGVPHLAFGHGVHHCLGAPLARAELRIALPALLRRFPDLRLDADAGDPVPLSGTVVHGLQSLPVTWGR